MMTIDEIYGQMVQVFQQETGVTLAGDGDMAVRLYAVAAQIYALYVQADWVNRQCFPQTAEGEYLDLHAQLRGLERRAAVAAVGILRFEMEQAANADLTIPAGTVCMTAGLIRFETTEAAVLRAGETAVEAPAAAVEPGAAGNVAAGTIRAMSVAPVGISQCTNPEGFSGGLDAESDDELREFVPKVSVYARVSPEHKIRIVRAWQERGNLVAMTGDGVNDAPALKQADIGVAMGITGTEVAKDAAGMVLTDDNFATIVQAVKNGRNVYANIKKAIQFLLSGNTAGILTVLYASLAGLPVPFAAVHLLFINLLTDSLPAIALGLESHSDAVMREKPRPRSEGILTKPFLLSVGTEGLVIALATIIAFHIGLASGGAAVASTMAFATLCLSRLFHGFNCKSGRPVIFTRAFWNNKFLLGAFAVGALLLAAVLLVPPLEPLFQVAELSAGLVAAIVGLAFGSMVVIQILKAIRTMGKR